MLFVERRELLDRFRTGDRRALEEVYRHYRAEVLAFLSRGFSFRSGERTLRFRGYVQPFDLNNALQETFMRAFKESGRLGYDGVRPYKWYLLTIARNVVIDELRRPDAAALHLVDAEGDLVPANGEHASEPGENGHTVEQALLLREVADLCQRFIAGLDEPERLFFRARFEEERSHLESGRACGKSPMQARTLEKKLRRRFLEYMQSKGYLESYGGKPDTRVE